jgi:hypothetical protein
LPIDEHDDDRLVVRLPEAFEEGVLEVRLGDAAPVVFALVHDGEATAHGADPWAPLDAERGTR